MGNNSAAEGAAKSGTGAVSDGYRKKSSNYEAGGSPGKEYREPFKWGPFLRALLIIALPVAFQNLLTTTGSMVDTIMLASLGEKTVGAVGLCAQFTSLMFSGYWGFIGGGMLFMSQYWGAGDGDGIRHSFGIMMTFLGAVAVIFTVVATVFPGQAMALYTNNREIQRLGVPYLSLVGFAYPFQILCVGMSALLRSIEKVRIPLYGGIAAVVTNCVCNYILIFGKLGFPAMGTRGAAVGTILSSIVNLAVLLFAAVKFHLPYLLDIREHFRFPKKLLKNFLGKSFPIICNEVAMGVANMMINVVLGRQSAEAIAAVAVFRVLEGVVISFFSGFSNAASVLVGKEVGAGNHEAAFARAKRIIYLASGFTAIVCGILIAVHGPLLHVMSLKGESYRIGTSLLMIYGVIAVIRMGNWCTNDTYRAAGDPAFGSVLEISFMFALVLPTVYICNFVLHAPFLVVFMLCYGDEPIRYILMQIHLYSGKWIRPVSYAGMETIGQFRSRHGIVMKNGRRGKS